MFNLQFFSLETLSREHFWIKVLAATGTVTGCYGVYRFFANRKFIPDINKKCVLITGCDSGFGRGLALYLDGKGCIVFAGCLTEDGASRLNKESSSQLQTVLLDVSSTESIKMAYEFVKSHIPEGAVFWGVVNNAGIGGAGGPVEFVARSEYEQVMQVNFFGQTDIISTFLPLLKKSQGRIVNVASGAVISPGPGMSAYVASKFAVLGYSEALRREKKIWGIEVSTIIPGLYKTGIVSPDAFVPVKQQQWEGLPDEIREEYGQEYYDSYIKMLKDYMQKYAKPNITPVIRGMEHALFSVKPKAKYLIGFDAKLCSVLESLPFGIMDQLFMKTPEEMLPKVLKNRKL